MKITFEGKTFSDIFDQMQDLLRESVSAKKNTTALPASKPVAEAQGPGPEPKAQKAAPVEIPAEKPGEKPAEKTVDPRIAKMQAAKAAKKAAREAEAVAAVETKLNTPQEAKPPIAPEPSQDDLFDEEVDPAEVVKIRQKTLEDLRTAYANGHQKEVTVLLSLHGNGAKTFRELPPEAFLPIRKAIDNGALEGATN